MSIAPRIKNVTISDPRFKFTAATVWHSVSSTPADLDSQLSASPPSRKDERGVLGSVTFDPNTSARQSYLPVIRRGLNASALFELTHHDLVEVCRSRLFCVPLIRVRCAAQQRAGSKPWPGRTTWSMPRFVPLYPCCLRATAMQMVISSGAMERTVQLRATVNRPQLLVESSIEFPIVQEAHEMIVPFIVQNPTSSPLALSLVGLPVVVSIRSLCVSGAAVHLPEHAARQGVQQPLWHAARRH